MNTYEGGENQTQLNPALQLGSTVIATPNDVDAIVYGLKHPISGTVIGYRYSESVVVQDHRNKFYIFKMEQLKSAKSN